ncbi:GNAT family N-acetyltransferase [Stakelama tenebrarum]|uniref:GNAT family N-acetyltransferase n=1 Tax=Stakelama tenebrarum TaxID=2711215 RepID=A0A6G6Y9E9_9SPHN|nr:GNAT family N-acetyltransferase [Sphingosinithalassobacter tenebrarum]QIG81471.1 GNAT family N-acetyltransferase [Sphingosinithalassobacter tenebrarum]
MSAEPEPLPIETRWAERRDLPRLRALMERAIEALQHGLLSPEQIAASHAIMGLDTQLVEDGTYLIAERGDIAVGCGGWSGRATLYGGDHGVGLRAPALLDPAIYPARIRAMYTHPDHARQGIGRRILAECEAAAAGAGFSTVELMATLSGQRLYAVSGYTAIENVVHAVDGVAVPLVRMRKRIAG